MRVPNELARDLRHLIEDILEPGRRAVPERKSWAVRPPIAIGSSAGLRCHLTRMFHKPSRGDFL
jgi:hypothetical protein